MPRFEITLSDGTRIVFGWDAFLGFFCEARRGRRRVLDYDALTEGYRGLPGLLDALVAAEVFTQDEIEAGLTAVMQVCCTDDIEDDHVRAVATIVHQLKQAAGE